MTTTSGPPATQTGVGLRIANVTKTYGDHTVLGDVSFDIRASEFTTLLGASGSGKSTLLDIVAGFISPDGGRVEADGRDMVVLSWGPAQTRLLGDTSSTPIANAQETAA